MKLMKLMLITCLLLAVSPAAFALVWQEPYWLPVGTPDPAAIEFGSSVTAASGAFASIDRAVHFRAELKTSQGTLVTVLEDKLVDLSVSTGYEKVLVSAEDYVEEGNYFVHFIISDSHGTESKLLMLTVNEKVQENKAPMIDAISDKHVAEGDTLSFTVSGNDPDGDQITFSAAGLPHGSVFNPVTRTFTWTPDYDWAGTYIVPFSVTDVHGATDTAQARIIVSDTNRCPLIDRLPEQTVTEGERLVFRVTASDPDQESVIFSAEDMPQGANFQESTGLFVWTPSDSQSGSYDVIFSADDGDCTVSAVMKINVFDSNELPSAIFTVSKNPVDEDEETVFSCSSTEGEWPHIYTIDFGDGTSIPASQASHSYSTQGDYIATCTATDADGDSDSAVIVVHVDDAKPTVILTAIPTTGTAPLDVDFRCDTPDALDPYVARIDFGDGNSIPSKVASHTYTSRGRYTASCTITEADGDIGYDSLTIMVEELPDACPGIDLIGDKTVVVGETLEFTVTANDAEGDSITYSADAPFSGFIDQATGEFSWTPVDVQAGNHIATFRVGDGTCEDSETITITVLELQTENHAPVADFIWNPANPEVWQLVEFVSTSTDPDGDSLTCEWDFNSDSIIDSTDCTSITAFMDPGIHPVTLTVSDGELSDSVTKIIEVTGTLDVTSITCFDPVVEDNLQSCSVSVQDSNEVNNIGGAVVTIYHEDGATAGSCVTSDLTGACSVSFPSGSPGIYTVHASAEKPFWISDLDSDPSFTYTVFEKRYDIEALVVYNDPLFTQEDYDFFRGEDMYVHFTVRDELGELTDDVVTSVALISPPGGRAWFDGVTTMPQTLGNYYYTLTIPTTHDFLGDSQVFTFAFNFDDESGAQQVVEVTIRNNPPVIDSAVADEFQGVFDQETTIDLSSYKSDVEDSGADLTWSFTGVDPAVMLVSIAGDLLTLTPVAGGIDVFTLILADLDGDTDSIDLTVRTDGFVQTQCSDGIDNDADGLIDMDDPGCSDANDDDESNDPITSTQCSDNVDNDLDGLVDMDDPGCVSPEDDDESDDPITSTQCSDGIDNDGDGLIDMDDPGCSDVNDDDEFNQVPGDTQCSDWIDNDGDGLIDMDDPQCTSIDDDREGYPVVSKDPYRFRDSDDLMIRSMSLGNGLGDVASADAGYLRMSFNIYNNMDDALKSVKVEVSIDELGVRESDMVRKLGNGEDATVVFDLELPGYVEPGFYDAKIIIGNDVVRRVKYREIMFV